LEPVQKVVILSVGRDVGEFLMAGGQVISVRFDFECRSAGSSRQNPMKKNWRGLIVVRKYFQKIRARTQLWLWSQALFRSFRLNRRFSPLSS